MSIKTELQNSKVYFNLQLLASQVVEGMITGIHKKVWHCVKPFLFLED